MRLCIHETHVDYSFADERLARCCGVRKWVNCSRLFAYIILITMRTQSNSAVIMCRCVCGFGLINHIIISRIWQRYSASFVVCGNVMCSCAYKANANIYSIHVWHACDMHRLGRVRCAVWLWKWGIKHVIWSFQQITRYSASAAATRCHINCLIMNLWFMMCVNKTRTR